MVGAVIASYAIAQLLLRAPLGVWADVLGRRKPFVVAGLLITTAGALALAAAPNPWFLFAGRALTGVAAATWVVSTVFFASYFPPERSARAIGIISFVNSTAMVVATSAGGQLAELWGAKSVFFVGAALGILGALLLMRVPEPAVPRSKTLSGAGFLKVGVHPVVLMASLMSILVHFAGAATISSFTLVYASRIGASSADLGLINGVYLGAATLATLGTIFMLERRGYPLTILLGASMLGASLLVTPSIDQLKLLVALQLLGGFGRGLANTSLMALSISAVQPGQRATAMGVYQALYSLGMLSGPLVGGFVADASGLSSVFYLSATAAFLAGGLALTRNQRAGRGP